MEEEKDLRESVPIAVIDENRLETEQSIRAELEANYATRLNTEIQQISQRMTEENKQLVDAAIKRIREELAPPTEQDLQKLLSQEYLEFKVDLRMGNKEMKTFTIVELPHSVEKKILKRIKAILVPFASDLSAISMELLEGDAAKKIVQLMNTFEPVLDAMVALCTICLNPFDEETDIDEAWVATHLSSTRIVKIVTAQLEVNRWRDFFSLLFRSTKSMTQ